MRTDLSPSLVHHLGGSFFRPTYLIEILHGTDIENPDDVWRWSTNQDNITWNGYTWTLQGFNIKGLNWDARATSKVNLEIQNLDSVIITTLLNNDLVDKPINIWMLYMYNKNIFISDITNLAGSNYIQVTEPIPADIPSSGTLYITGTRVAPTSTPHYSTTISYPYTSWSGRSFTLSTPLTDNIDSGAQIYIRKDSYNEKDAVKVFSGVLDGLEYDEKSCNISLSPESSKTQYTPRRYITKRNGFSFLPQSGLKFYWGGETFTLERAKY